MSEVHIDTAGLSAILAPPADAKALIFDCDGTLALTADAHFRALSVAFGRAGQTFERDWYWQRLGLSLKELVIAYQRDFGHETPVDLIRAGHHESFTSQIASVTAFEAVVDVARKYHGRLPLAVASGADDAVLRLILDHLQITPLFDAIVGIGRIKVGKPAPDSFLEAARQLRMEPDDCFVYEDTEEGVAAAKAAGMSFVNVARYRTAY